MLEIRHYVTSDGSQPFADWFADLEAIARAKVTTAMIRMEQGNLSNAKSVGDGVLEYRIDFGPGYGAALVILLTGGTTKRQQKDSEAAHGYWNDYKQRRRR